MKNLNRGFMCIFTSVSILLIIFLQGYEIAPCESDVERTISEIDLSEEALGSAFVSVLEAERAGGDVSELIVSLNIALEWYSEAETAFRSGEYDSAVLLAEKVVEASNMISDASASLRGIGVNLEEIAFTNQLLLSFGVICFAVLFGFLGWRRFKGYYVRMVMGLRPEVAADEP